MEVKFNEQILYSFHQTAQNEPLQFLDDTKSLNPKTTSTIELSRLIYRIKALFNCGKVSAAFQLISDIEPALTQNGSHMLLGKYYLVAYAVAQSAGEPETRLKEFHDLAEKHVKQSGSRGLASEFLRHKLQNTLSDFTMDAGEEYFKEAMNHAINASIPILILETHLAYCYLYQYHSQTSTLQKELSILTDLVTEQTYPHLFAKICNYSGIANMMLRSFSEAEESFNTAIQVCNKMGYQITLMSLIMNQAMSKMNLQDFEGGLAAYEYAIELVKTTGMENSPIADKIHGNYARALARVDRGREAVFIMKQSLSKSQENGDLNRGSILKVNLADVLIELEDYQEAEAILDEAIEHFDNQKHFYYQSQALKCKARLYEAQNDFQNAFDNMVLHSDAFQKHFSDNLRVQSNRFQQRISNLRNEYIMLKTKCNNLSEPGLHNPNSTLIGEHLSVKKALSDAVMAAKYPHINVFISGESGTGKEVIARIIHHESNTGKPLVAVNASAISPNLIESELFGHKKGAFTGAIEDRKGKFIMADNGTLFLDEVSEMPIECQAKLLRAIETRTVIPVGSDKEIKINCRIISTTNRNILEMIRTNTFRLDLYHRLNKVEIHLIPLRERKSDIEALAWSFISRFSRELNQSEPRVNSSFFDRLRDYSFPGNVRELMNIIERIFILKPQSIWDADQLDGLLGKENTYHNTGEGLTQSLKVIEQQMITEALEHTGWKQKEAANILKITESTLSRRIQALQINRT